MKYDFLQDMHDIDARILLHANTTIISEQAYRIFEWLKNEA